MIIIHRLSGATLFEGEYTSVKAMLEAPPLGDIL